MNYFDSEPLAVNPLQYSGKLMTWTELFEMIRSGLDSCAHMVRFAGRA